APPRDRPPVRRRVGQLVEPGTAGTPAVRGSGLAPVRHPSAGSGFAPAPVRGAAQPGPGSAGALLARLLPPLLRAAGVPTRSSAHRRGLLRPRHLFADISRHERRRREPRGRSGRALAPRTRVKRARPSEPWGA